MIESPPAGGRRARLVASALVAAILLLAGQAAIAQTFPEPPFLPDRFSLPAGDSRPLDELLRDATPPDVPMTTFGFTMAREDYLALLRHLTGQEMGVMGLGATLGSQYLRVDWESAADGSMLPVFTTTLIASDGEKAQVGLPLAVERGHSALLRYDSAGMVGPGGAPIEVGRRSMFAFQPAVRTQHTLYWTGDRALTSIDDGVVSLTVPLAARPFSILDIRRPSGAPAASELIVQAGISPESIRRVPGAPEEWTRFFLFTSFDAPQSRSITFAWVEPAAAPAPKPRVESRIVTRYEILPDEVRLTSERHYTAPSDDDPIRELPLLIPEVLVLEAVRCSVPADYDRAPADLLTVRPRTPAVELTVVLVARYKAADFTRGLLSIVDPSRTRVEEVIVESPGMNSYLDAGVQGLAEAGGAEPAARRSLHSIRRHWRTMDRRAGFWTAQFHHFVSPFKLASVQTTNVHVEGAAIRVGEEFTISAPTAEEGKVALRQPVQIELDPRVDPASVTFAFDGDEPATRTLTLRPGVTREDSEVLLAELSWNEAPAKVTLRLEYALPFPPDAARRPSSLPFALVVGAQYRDIRIHLAADEPIVVTDEGDFTVTVAESASQPTLPIAPSPMRAMSFHERFASRHAGAPRTPAIQRAPAGDAP